MDLLESRALTFKPLYSLFNLHQDSWGNVDALSVHMGLELINTIKHYSMEHSDKVTKLLG